MLGFLSELMRAWSCMCSCMGSISVRLLCFVPAKALCRYGCM